MHAPYSHCSQSSHAIVSCRCTHARLVYEAEVFAGEIMAKFEQRKQLHADLRTLDAMAPRMTQLGQGQGQGQGQQQQQQQQQPSPQLTPEASRRELRDLEQIVLEAFDFSTHRTHSSHMSHPTFPISHLLFCDLLEAADIVFCTMSGAADFRLVDVRFETAVFDEAAQAGELATLIPLTYGARLAVLVGDPQQLPATVVSPQAKARGFERSLFERLMQSGLEKHVRALSPAVSSHRMPRFFPYATLPFFPDLTESIFTHLHGDV